MGVRWGVWLGMWAVLGMMGCRAPAATVYPSFRTAEQAWLTYKRAWQLGDVDVLRATYGGNLAFQFREELEANGAAATSAYYSRDFEKARFEEEDFYFESESLAYLQLRLGGPQVTRTLRYSLVRFGSYWKIVAFVLVEPDP